MGAESAQSQERQSASSDFFKNVSATGFPVTRDKEQPWKRFMPQTQSKQPVEDGKMVVLCSMRHDYGEHESRKVQAQCH